jgi:tight adherence protein C
MAVPILLIMGACLMLGLAIAAGTRPNPARRRLVRLADGSRAPRPSMDDQGLLSEEAPDWLLRMFRVILGASPTKEKSNPARLRQRLIEAGYRRPSAVTLFMGGRLTFAIGLPLLLLLVPLAWQLTQIQSLSLIGLATGVGYVLPSYWVDKSRKSRRRAIERSLPDALDLMVVCVQAGLGILASLDRVVQNLRESHAVLCAEFELSIYEIRAGKSVADGLRGLADRTGASEMSALVAMLVQTERFGTSIADTLRVHADSLRSRRMQRAEELANKAPLKMLFPTTLIFAATLVVTIGPAVVQITSFFTRQ